MSPARYWHPPLQYLSHNDSDALRMEISSSLVGRAALEAYEAGRIESTGPTENQNLFDRQVRSFALVVKRAHAALKLVPTSELSEMFLNLGESFRDLSSKNSVRSLLRARGDTMCNVFCVGTKDIAGDVFNHLNLKLLISFDAAEKRENILSCPRQFRNRLLSSLLRTYISFGRVFCLESVYRRNVQINLQLGLTGTISFAYVTNPKSAGVVIAARHKFAIGTGIC